jgi:hypothetical protein
MMDSFADLLADEIANSRRGPRCTMCGLLENLDDADSSALQKALDDTVVTSAVIMRTLRRQGHPVRDEAIRRHRRGECMGTRG